MPMLVLCCLKRIEDGSVEDSEVETTGFEEGAVLGTPTGRGCSMSSVCVSRLSLTLVGGSTPRQPHIPRTVPSRTGVRLYCSAASEYRTDG
jgi:hypothetical protein